MEENPYESPRTVTKANRKRPYNFPFVELAVVVLLIVLSQAIMYIFLHN
jgi:hypothetical protein